MEPKGMREPSATLGMTEEIKKQLAALEDKLRPVLRQRTESGPVPESDTALMNELNNILLAITSLVEDVRL